MTTPAAQPPRVFLSSTYADLREHRTAVRDVIRRLGAVDVSMEAFGARDERPKDEVVRLLRETTDIFVGIYAYRYGFVPPGDSRSITETEYETATAAGLPRFIFIVDDDALWHPRDMERGSGEPLLAALKARLKANHLCDFFSTPDDLAKRVAAGLGRHLAVQQLHRVPPEERAPAPLTPDVPTQLSSFRERTYAETRGFFLVHTIDRSALPGQRFDVHIYIHQHATRSRTTPVEAAFFFGPRWGNRVVGVRPAGGLLGITTAAYAPFLCVCRISFDDGGTALLSRYIDFEAGPAVESSLTHADGRAGA